jgi:hypothetical protein
VVFVLCIISILTDTIATILVHSKVITTHWIENIYTLLEGASLYLFFYLLFLHSKKWYKNITILSACLFVGMWSFRDIIGKGFFKFDSLTAGFECLFAIILCVAYYIERVTSADTNYAYSIPNFWIVTGFLLYLASSFFLVLNLLDIASERAYDYIIGSSVILRNILIAIAFTMKEPKPQSLSMQNPHLYFDEENSKPD